VSGRVFYWHSVIFLPVGGIFNAAAHTRHRCSQSPRNPAVTIAETSRLIIRQLTINDAEFVLTLTNEPSSI